MLGRNSNNNLHPMQAEGDQVSDGGGIRMVPLSALVPKDKRIMLLKIGMRIWLSMCSTVMELSPPARYGGL